MSKLTRLFALAALVVITGLHLLSPVESAKSSEYAQAPVPTNISWFDFDPADGEELPLPCAYTWAG